MFPSLFRRRPSGPSHAPDRDVGALFLRWAWMRAVLHRGYWLVTSLYLVVVADLSAFELVFLGTAQSLISLVFEVPAGVIADTVSRKWALVLSHVLMGTSMVATGLVTSFPALVATQMLWGVAWTFSSGADVAWLTDELDRPDRVSKVLTAFARWEQLGSATGLVAFGLLAWATGLTTAIVVAGVAMAALGLHVAARFTEHQFVPVRKQRWRRSAAIFRGGVLLARRDREILLVFAATFLVNGAAEAFGRLYPKHLVALGFPEEPDPIAWFTALGVATLTLSVLTLRIVEAPIDGRGVAQRVYAAACFVGALGLIILAHAPDDVTAMAGVLLVGGVGFSVTRAVSVIWVNRRATSDVRATVHSFLAQVEYAGEITCGVALGVLAQATSITMALTFACALIALAGVLVRSRACAPGDHPAAPVPLPP